MGRYRVKEIVNKEFDFINVKENSSKKYIVQEYGYYYKPCTDEYGNYVFSFVYLYIYIIVAVLIFFKMYKKQWYKIYSYNNKKDAITVLNYLKRIDKND